jgi:ubiquinone/menaquinone biosynthesis C-methylase UbiE
MGWYADVLFPKAYDCLMALAKFDDQRRRSLQQVRGKVLEVGIGTGLNLPHYPEELTRLTAVEPNPGMLQKLARKESRIELEALQAGAEKLPFEDGSFDTVVTTLVLCSLPNRAKALSEIRRVLRPDGRYVFLEHGLSPDARVARWQRRLNGIQRRFAAGCLLDVPVREELTTAGFEFAGLEEYYLKKQSRTHTYFYDGVAVPVRSPSTECPSGEPRIIRS